MDDGRWYLVDVTWDDMMTETSGKLCSDYFLAGMDDVDCFGMTIASHYRSTGVMSGGAPLTNVFRCQWSANGAIGQNDANQMPAFLLLSKK